MTLAPVAPAPGPERAEEYPRSPWNACQRLFPADAWMHDNLRILVSGTPGPLEKPFYGRLATRLDGSTRGRPYGPAWLHAAATQAVPAVPIPRGVRRDRYLAGKDFA
jgi:hypothetical protein